MQVKLLRACAERANKDDAAKLTALCDRDVYGDAVRTARLRISDVLEAHPSARLPLDVFLSLTPPLQVSATAAPRVR